MPCGLAGVSNWSCATGGRLVKRPVERNRIVVGFRFPLHGAAEGGVELDAVRHRVVHDLHRRCVARLVQMQRRRPAAPVMRRSFAEKPATLMTPVGKCSSLPLTQPRAVRLAPRAAQRRRTVS